MCSSTMSTVRDTSPLTKKLILAALVLIFLLQSYLCVVKFLERKIVDETLTVEQDEEFLPCLTLCGYPYRSDLTGNMILNRQLSHYCPPNATDFIECLGAGHFTLDDMVEDTQWLITGRSLDKSWWGEATYNFFNGKCFTLRIDTPSKANFVMDMVLMRFNWTTLQRHKMNMRIQIHGDEGYLPNPIYGKEFLHRQIVDFIPSPLKYTGVLVNKKKRTNINYPKGRCQEDPNWDIIRCIEEYIIRKIGCTYPWILRANLDGVKNCSTREEFGKLLGVHGAILNTSPSKLPKLTGCPPPCTLNDFAIATRDVNFGGVIGNSTGITYYLGTTNLEVTKETWLYDVNNLIGEIGGSLGLFLGASLLTIFEVVQGGFMKVFHVVNGGTK
ncbi:acid-sensing ion channel 5-like [Tigriopus californicus]|uniref:acid-sensing ion channel 5-like n=1 Tax=Tigriopus californicus TaxID=6832 RepID=UPI0027DA20EF|nr:acid-sensing ion channel 5-like [Tigriopus californicus]|eukprot:TCALIF_12152-PA protein Name:"Protein of unknown function" AED:0.07 eAED:0.07 QI:26/1/0.33/1/1/0.66/3/0/384